MDAGFALALSLIGLCTVFYWIWRGPRWDDGEPRAPMAE